MKKQGDGERKIIFLPRYVNPCVSFGWSMHRDFSPACGNGVEKHREGLSRNGEETGRRGAKNGEAAIRKRERRGEEMGKITPFLNLKMVPKEGLEPSCHRWRQILSLVRLPFRHFGTSVLAGNLDVSPAAGNVL